MESERHLLKELANYKQKYYLNLILKGLLLSTALLLTAYISLNLLEYLGRFNSYIRAVFFFSFVTLAALTGIFWVLLPLLSLLHLNSPISDEEAALQIGRFFPEIDDKLLNTLQLQKLGSRENSLILASIEQRTRQLSIVKFTDAVKLEENRKYLKFIIVPLLLLLFIFLISPTIFSEIFAKSSARIVFFSKKFADPAPFVFVLGNKKLQAFKNEDFKVSLSLKGQAIPSEVYLTTGERKYKMLKNDDGSYSFTFTKLQKPIDFFFEAAGFHSDSYNIQLIERPSLLSFDAYVTYPAYLGKPNETWNNIGNLIVPEGTIIQWKFNTHQAELLQLTFVEEKKTIDAQKTNGSKFEYNKQVKNSLNYQIKLKNTYSTNKEEINYYINVIPDAFPKISMEEFRDTAIYNYLSVGGNISDDYGLTQLKLFYSIRREGKIGTLQSIDIPINRDQTIQNYYYSLSFEQMNLKPGDQIEYYAQVWDNDGFNGAKSARSSMQTFKIPNEADLKEEIANSEAETSKQIDRTLQKAQKLREDIDKLENKLRNKDRLDYQDKKMAEEILKKKQELNEEVKKLQEQYDMTNEKKERFFETDPETAEKIEQLKKLMDDLLDEETKKLYEELQKLLDQNRDNESVLDKLKEINEKEENFEKELERTLEMFKQLQFEQKLEQATNDLKKLAEEQEKLSEQTENKEKGNEELLQEQKELNEKFEDIKKEMDELKEMDKELEEPNGMDEMDEKNEELEKEIDQEQENSMDQLQKNQNKKAGKSQKNAGEKMQKMAQQMQEMQEGMEMEQMMENIDDLRAILENLVSLSFDQESLMKEFRNVNLSDPRYIPLAQKQLKLKDDAKIIEDSLQALAKRVFQLQSFVTRELNSMKGYMKESSELIKQRKLGNATGKQQLAMTAMNNLALMLSDALQQMQNSMQNAMSSSKKGKGKPQKSPSLGKLQQMLNQKIDELKKSGKSGRQLSEELAKLAAEQEKIRRMLQELQKKNGGKEAKDQLSKELAELMKEMEKTEEELVNKRLDQELIKRQKDIETRLLESEKSMRERGEEEERKAEQSKTIKKSVPPNLNQYFKNKEKQIELLKTIPPALTPYYKKEVDEYFEKIEK